MDVINLCFQWNSRRSTIHTSQTPTSDNHSTILEGCRVISRKANRQNVFVELHPLGQFYYGNIVPQLLGCVVGMNFHLLRQNSGVDVSKRMDADEYFR